MRVVYGVTLTTSLSCILSSIRSNGSDISQDVMISHSLILEDKLCQITICFFGPLRNTSKNSEIWMVTGAFKVHMEWKYTMIYAVYNKKS